MLASFAPSVAVSHSGTRNSGERYICQNLYTNSSRSFGGRHYSPVRSKHVVMSSLRIAAVGCVHGELDAIYTAVSEAVAASEDKRPVDLIVCAGDFQAVRNEADLECMSVPDKYKDMRSFWMYYSGQKTATIPTVFVGGNHEASNYLQELPLGGLVAPNMYYMGNSSVINFRGLRIAGISGVYVEHNYLKPRYERPPYEGSGALKSVYHARKMDVDMLSRISRPVDVFISHDWPRGIADFGDKAALLRAKPYLTKEVNDGRFGNPGTAELLNIIKPRYWFAAHIHVKFSAIVSHPGSDSVTKFLALDKALPRRDFVQILDILPSNASQAFEPPSELGTSIFNVDPEWLSVLRSHSHSHDAIGDDEMNSTISLVEQAGLNLYVRSPDDFERNAEPHEPSRKRRLPRPSSLSIERRNERLAHALGLAPFYQAPAVVHSVRGVSGSNVHGGTVDSANGPGLDESESCKQTRST